MSIRCSHGDARPPDTVERYYDERYFVSVKGELGCDQYVHIHSNGLVVIGIADSHACLQYDRIVTSIDFNVGKRNFATAPQVLGKKKRGALQVGPHTLLCEIVCNDGSRFPVYFCVHGHVIEVNRTLLDNPVLLMERARTDGFIAIVNASITTVDKLLGKISTSPSEDVVTTEERESQYANDTSDGGEKRPASVRNTSEKPLTRSQYDMELTLLLSQYGKTDGNPIVKRAKLE